MNILLEKSVVTAIGEHAVFVELLRRGFDAYLAQGPNQPGWDIVVVSENSRTLVQVKATQLETIQIDFGQEFHYLVIVLVSTQSAHVDNVGELRFYVFSKIEAESLASDQNELRRDNARSIYIPKTTRSAKYDFFQGASGKWSKIVGVTP